MRYWDCAPSRNLAETKARIPRNTPRFAMWAVLARDGRQFLGMVNYHHRHAGHRRLAIGYILAREHWRKGLMSEALAPFLDHCFGALASHRVEAHIEPENAASRALVEKLGFGAEGLLRDHIRVGSRYRSVVVYGLLADEWHARRPAPKAKR